MSAPRLTPDITYDRATVSAMLLRLINEYEIDSHDARMVLVAMPNGTIERERLAELFEQQGYPHLAGRLFNGSLA